MNKFVDLHQHFLWNMDDGPETQQLAQAMLERSAQEGIGTLAATPHVYPGIHPFDMKDYLQRIEIARQLVENMGLRILTGAEIHYTSATLPMLQDGRIPTIGDTDYVLIEFRNDVRWTDVFHAVDRLFRYGYVPILAHVERYRCFTTSPRTAMVLKQEADVCLQVNAQSLLTPSDWFTRRFLKKMLQEHAIDIIATDAHDCLGRPPVLRPAYDFVCREYGEAYADSMFNFDIQAQFCSRS